MTPKQIAELDFMRAVETLMAMSKNRGLTTKELTKALEMIILVHNKELNT